jgi:hypothetical protein
MPRILTLAVLAWLAACGDSSSSGCTDTQVEVKYLGGGSDGKTVCQPIPAQCGATAACANQPCIAAMYNLCAAPYIGVGCSDTFPPTIISCNP